jgi:HSP20 family molecular chaperone IbpA
MSLISSLIHPTEAEQHATQRPRFDIEETDLAFGLTVFLPGVAKSGLEITDEGGELHIRGKRTPGIPEAASALHRESSDAPYELVLSHDSTVDTGKVVAELKDGVLRLSVPKAESAKPRKIAIN